MKRVVLVRTQGPRNAGLAARACANFGPCELWFVRPAHGDLLGHREFRDMSHGVDPALAPPVVATLDEALAECTYAVGFTARLRESARNARWPDVVSDLARRAADPDERVALVFGNERVGLTEEEAHPLAQLIWIPTSDEHTSLNLAAAVTLVLGGLFDQDRPLATSKKGRPVTGEDRAFLVRRMCEVLGDSVGSAPAARDLRRSIERVFGRAILETRDARAWHRLLRHIGGARTPQDYDLAPPARTGRKRTDR